MIAQSGRNAGFEKTRPRHAGLFIGGRQNVWLFQLL